METANAARAPPKMSNGIVYTLTLTAETARMLSEIPAYHEERRAESVSTKRRAKST
jgi:hypothetical protein